MRSALTAKSAVVLTACLSCSWVHDFPGTCPRSSETWRKLRRDFGGNTAHLHGIPAMATFVHGSNGIVVPRGLFYESKLNQTLGGSDPRSSNPALTKMTVQANQFAISGTLTLDAYLNARPIQQVLSGNVTLDEAQWFVDQLRLNRTGKTTAFLLDVTDEFYTMGFVGAVIALSPNATVDNSVNHTPTQPPAPWWEQLFNVIVSVAAIAWNAALAVANFFVNLVKFLVNIVVGLVIGLATGNWNYFVDNVVKPFVEAMNALIKFIIDLINTAINVVFGPIIQAITDALKAFAGALLGGIGKAYSEWTAHGTLSRAAAGEIANTLFGTFFQILLLIGVVIVVVLTLATPFLALGGFLIGFLVSALAGFLLDGAFASRPSGPDVPEPGGADDLANPLSSIVGFAAQFVHDNHGTHLIPWHAFLWTLGGAVLSGASFYASLFGLALTDKTGKTASIISLAGSTLSLAIAIAATLVEGFGESNYALGAFSVVISFISLITSGYGLYKSLGGAFDVKILSLISTIASGASLVISIYTLL